MGCDCFRSCSLPIFLLKFKLSQSVSRRAKQNSLKDPLYMQPLTHARMHPRGNIFIRVYNCNVCERLICK